MSPSIRPDASFSTGPPPIAVGARIAMLALTTVLILVATGHLAQLGWVALLAVAGAPAVFAARHATAAMVSRYAEAGVVGLAAGSVAADAATPITSGAAAGFGAQAVLPYLMAPVLAAALRRRVREGAILLCVAAAALALGGLVGDGIRPVTEPAYLAAGLLWLTIGVIVTIGADTVRQLMQPIEAKPQSYAEATRLLTQLRSVARSLPGATLDPGGISEHLLEELRGIAPAQRAAVLSASGGGRLGVLAQTGAERVDWETTMDSDSALADAWASQQPHTANRSQARSHHGNASALVVPLVAGVRTIGLVVLESDAPNGYPKEVVDAVTAVTRPAALRLEAALLFDDVRSLATNEERQRLAREIHDGVAQELVMVGYGIDNALATLPEDATETAEDLRTLRGEVTRVITELRLSLFELRSEVDRHGGLAAAIAEYARTVGTSAGLRVHFTFDETTARLPAGTEAELLRIAQEAITNARKHAGAANLWVTCAVDPPYAQIEISDDGRGIDGGRPDGHYGLAIMAERAERIRGRLEIRPRHPRGTTVAVVLGTPSRRDSVRDSVSAPEGE